MSLKQEERLLCPYIAALDVLKRAYGTRYSRRDARNKDSFYNAHSNTRILEFVGLSDEDREDLLLSAIL